jgi:rhodanese-related sulfurtransferase
MTETLEPKEAREPIAAGEFHVIDVRSQEEWESESDRVPGAVHIPADELGSRLDEVPEDKKILLVSPNGEGCEEAAQGLEGRDVAVLEGGVEGWRGDRLMTQPSPDADPPKGEGEEPVETPEDDEDSDTSEGRSEGTSEGTSESEDEDVEAPQQTVGESR